MVRGVVLNDVWDHRYLKDYESSATDSIVNRYADAWHFRLYTSADHVPPSVEELAKKKGTSMAQISLAWIMAKPSVSAPIIGTTNLSNLEDILGQYISE